MTLTTRQQEVIGVGMKFPVQFDDLYGGVVLSEGQQRIIEALWLILSTRMFPWPDAGEVVMHPELGSQLYRILHRPINEMLRSEILAWVIEAARQERRITVLDIKFLSALDLRYPSPTGPRVNTETAYALLEQGHEIVDIYFMINKDQTPGNCVFPFYTDADMNIAGYGYVYPRSGG